MISSIFSEKVIRFLIFALMVIAVSACKKGDTGPAGPQGPQGPQGPSGNPDIVVYNFGSQTTTTGSIDYVITNISQGKIDSSLILAYYNPSNEAATAWYQCPGLGSTGAYITRYFIYQTSVTPSNYTMGVRLVNPNGSGAYTNSVTFTKFKIIIAPASSIITLSKNQSVNLADYNKVKEYFNLTD